MIKGCIFNLVGVVLKEVSGEETNEIHPALITPDHLIDGFLVFLKELKNKGVQVVVVSREHSLKTILDRLRITHLTSNYFSDDTIENTNEGTNIYLSVANSLQLNPNEMIVFISSETSEDINLLEKFNVVCVGAKEMKNTSFYHVNDFSSLKFNQLITSVTNFIQN